MQHNIPVEQLGAQAPAMADAISACVHCGFCLPACPTYQLLGDEADSPRGRIVLMKAVLEGSLPAAQAQPHIDRCLGCLGCVTACPSGVKYGALLSGYRALTAPAAQRGLFDSIARALSHAVLPRPQLFRIAALAARLAQPFAAVLPRSLRAMLELLPARLPAAVHLPAVSPALGTRRARVALLAGCAQQVLAPEINAATVRVLTRNGVEVLVPPAQGCCGALAIHTGAAPRARQFARNNLAAFPTDVDAILTTAAGCGSGIHDYPLLFAGTAEHAEAQAFAARTCDVSVFLDRLGLLPLPAQPQPRRVAYHDACHLSHAQGVRAAPRNLLRQIPGVTLLDLPEAELCCGSAGTYNIEQPQLAQQLGVRKAGHVRASAAQIVAMGNIGCMVQIQRSLGAAGSVPAVRHTMQVLDDAYQADGHPQPKIVPK